MARSLAGMADRDTHKAVAPRSRLRADGGEERGLGKRARGPYASRCVKTGNSGTIPYVVESCPNDTWRPGASFRALDVKAGLEAIMFDGVLAEAWPVGMIFVRAGRRLRVHRERSGRLSLMRA